VTYWEKLAAPAFPNATCLGRVHGIGPFALLSCLDGASRWVTLFMERGARNRAIAKWDRNKTCGMANCNDDHRMIDLGLSNETADTNSEGQARVAVHNSR
jgi:hypothetical protein